MEIEITDKSSDEYEGEFSFTKYTLKDGSGDGHFIGIDPGTANFGVALIHPNFSEVWQISIIRKRDPLQRMKIIQAIFPRIFCYEKTMISKSVIEAAAYNAPYRQVELAEQRAAIALYLDKISKEVEFKQAQAIRKIAFGKYDMLAHEFWTNLPSDCAAALSCAVVAQKTYR